MDHNSCNVKRERRLYPRIELLLPVKLLCQNGEVMLGETINVSPFGIRVRVETSKKSHHMTSDVVGVDFGPPGEADAQMPARAEVVRNCSSDKNDLALQVINPPDFCMAPSLIGKHPSLNHIKKRLMKMAGCDLTVLVTGESGTGKNRVAEVIHRYSQRKDKKFLRLNCPSIPESLFESQLFGAEKGAYTGASSPKPGLFRMGDGGTLLLDEISSLPLSLQAKLLQVIEDKSFYPVGASSPIRVDCRIIACTNENMGELVKKNKFREDLYYRLVEAKVHIPPLRKRKSDIPLLCDHFMRTYCRKYGKDYRPLDDELFEMFMSRSWYGNVRELEQVIKRWTAMGDVDVEHETGTVPQHAEEQGHRKNVPVTESAGLEKIIREKEKSAILEALRRSGGSKNEAAALLQVSYRTLQRKIRYHGLNTANIHPDVKSAEKSFPAKASTALAVKELSLDEIRQTAEAETIAAALERVNGDLTRAAAVLEVSYSTLLRKKKTYNLNN